MSKIEFECCFNSSIKHLCCKPIQLSCQHYACQSCLINSKSKLFQNLNQFGCKFCGYVYDTNGVTIENFQDDLETQKVLLENVHREYNYILQQLEGIQYLFSTAKIIFKHFSYFLTLLI